MAEAFILDFLDGSKSCDDLASLTALLQRTLEKIGFSRWAYATQSALPDYEKSHVIIHNYPEQWVSYYISNRYSEIDPVITKGSQQITPFVWSDLFGDSSQEQQQTSYINEAHDFGLVDGLGVPIVGLDRSYSVLSMASSEPTRSIRKTINRQKTELITLGLAFHCLSQRYVMARLTKPPAVILSPRERECLLWVMRGKSSWEIGQIINTTERTVVFHIENAKKKLGVTSRSHAVVRAMVEGHIAL